MEAAEYFSKDFEWEELKAEVENDSSFRFHLLPFQPSNRPSQTAPEDDSAAWKKFHIRHSSGKFFKVSIFSLFQDALLCLKLFNQDKY
jgi:methyltransferase-like protein 6